MASSWLLLGLLRVPNLHLYGVGRKFFTSIGDGILQSQLSTKPASDSTIQYALPLPRILSHDLHHFSVHLHRFCTGIFVRIKTFIFSTRDSFRLSVLSPRKPDSVWLEKKFHSLFFGRSSPFSIVVSSFSTAVWNAPVVWSQFAIQNTGSAKGMDGKSKWEANNASCQRYSEHVLYVTHALGCFDRGRWEKRACKHFACSTPGGRQHIRSLLLHKVSRTCFE